MSSDTKFSDNFWDEKLTGYLVLFQNVRNSQQCVKELEAYLRDCANFEDQYFKQLNKVSHLVQKFNPDSTIFPLYTSVLKEISEQNSWSHLKFMTKIYDLIKQVQMYSDELRKKKHKLKENDLKTIHVIEQFRQVKVQLGRAKDQYVQLVTELEKQKKILEHTQLTNQNSLQMLVQKLERKLIATTEEYQLIIDRYNTIRAEYEAKFTESCDQFQELERWHLTQMKSFMDEYLSLVHNLNSSRTKNLNECQHKLASFTTEQLLDQFLLNKSTGQYRPISVEFIKLTEIEPASPTSDRHEPKLLSFLSRDLLSKIKLRKTRTVTETEKTEPVKSDSMDSLDMIPESSTIVKDQGDMINFYEMSNDEDEQAKAWMKSDSDSSDDESDDSDIPKRIVLKIKPLDETERATSPDLLNQISKNLQLKPLTNTPRKRVYTRSFKLDENNNEIVESRKDEPPPLPPLPINLQLMSQKVSELNRNLERSVNQSPASAISNFNKSFDDYDEMQF